MCCAILFALAFMPATAALMLAIFGTGGGSAMVREGGLFLNSVSGQKSVRISPVFELGD